MIITAASVLWGRDKMAEGRGREGTQREGDRGGHRARGDRREWSLLLVSTGYREHQR